MGIMEYVLMTFFIMVVIVILIVFLSGWQVSQLRVEKQKTRTDAVMSAMKNALSSEFLTRGNSEFDDAKLLAMMSEGCASLEKILGKGAFLEITVFTTENIPCVPGEYDPDCSQWSFCVRPGGKFEAFYIPVNVYRKMGTTLKDGIISRTDIGIAKVGVYYED